MVPLATAVYNSIQSSLSTPLAGPLVTAGPFSVVVWLPPGKVTPAW